MTNTFNRNDGTFAQVDIASLGTTNFPLNSVTKATTVDIVLSTTSYFDGPTVSQGSSGTWFASGTVTLLSTGKPDYFAKLWDGTSVLASAATDPASSNSFITISLSGVLAAPAGNLRISVANSTSGGKILFNASGNSADSSITAVRIG